MIDEERMDVRMDERGITEIVYAFFFSDSRSAHSHINPLLVSNSNLTGLGPFGGDGDRHVCPIGCPPELYPYSLSSCR